MRCSKCGSENPAGKRFCSECGAGVPHSCPQCGADNAQAAKFCGECGVPLAAPLRSSVPETSPAQPREISGERRHLTVLFCDLVGSTEISARLDPEEWREIESGYLDAVAEAISRFGGFVAKYLGDGVMAYFGWPEAYDNNAERAARAGLAIVDAVGVLNRRDGQRISVNLAVRVGIDSGTVVIAKGGGGDSEVFGDTANIASRVQSAADPNTVIVTPALNRLISGLFVVEERGAHQLKGIAQSIELYRIVRLSGARSRLAASAAVGLTPFVGREDEKGVLWNRWERASEGEGQVVFIVGEAGIGKSRLLQQFRERLAGTAHTWNECAGAPYFQNTPFYPITDMLQQGFAPRGDETDEEKLSELERVLELAGLKLAEAVPLVAPMLNVALGEKYPPITLSPEQKRKRLLATLAGWLFGVARAQPAVMAIEDLHWFDASTLELIKLLIEQGATSPLLLLCTARPEFHPPWTPRAHHAQLTLNRLTARDVRELVGQVVASRTLSREAIDQVIERTGGVPLFVEELTRAVLERSDARPLAHEIPATLHDSLIARLDRLGRAKEAAQIASVVGREFSYELLLSVSTMPESDLQSALAKLADAELIYVRGFPPEATYSFKHALIQEAAYEALLKSRRRELHRRVAVVMTEQFPALAETQLEVVARHWTSSGEAGPAIAAWTKAADAAYGRRAFREAEEGYCRALAMLNTLPQSSDRDTRELTLQLALGGTMVVTQGWSAVDTVAAYTRARTLAERTGEAESLQVFSGLWGSALTRGEPRTALVLADQVLDIAGRVRRPKSLVIADFEQGLTRFFLGDLAASRQYFLRAAEQYCEEEFRGIPDDQGVHSLAFRGINEWLLGYPDQALSCRNDAESLARRLNKPFALVLANAAGFLTDAFRGDFERVFSASEELERLCTELGFPVHRSFCKIFPPWAHAKKGEVSGAATQIIEGLSEFDSIEFYLWRAFFLCLLGEAQALTGAVDEALVTVERALEINPDERLCRPEILRFHGELLLKKGQDELAERDFRDALELARSMSAKSWELRATTSLARLLEHQGRRAEARALLSEIYGWFTEGFDTADLKDAKALLEELSTREA